MKDKTDKIIIKNCICCGKIFMPQTQNTQYCEECKNMPRVNGTKIKSNCNKGLVSDLRKIDAYNKKHKTNISYGNYKSLLYSGNK